MQGNTYYDEYSTTKWQNLKKETHTVHTIKYMRIMVICQFIIISYK